MNLHGMATVAVLWLSLPVAAQAEEIWRGVTPVADLTTEQWEASFFSAMPPGDYYWVPPDGTDPVAYRVQTRYPDNKTRETLVTGINERAMEKWIASRVEPSQPKQPQMSKLDKFSLRMKGFTELPDGKGGTRWVPRSGINLIQY